MMQRFSGDLAAFLGFRLFPFIGGISAAFCRLMAFGS
jgi:hypothetical protein